MLQKEEPNELLKRVTAASLKAIAAVSDLEVSFAPGQSSETGHQAVLPTPVGSLDKGALTKLRGVSDALAVRLRYHDSKLHKKHMPMGPEARAVYESIEQVRCESLAIRRFNGVSKNLGALLDERCKSKGFDDLTEQNDTLLPEAIGLLVRESLTGEPTPKSASGLMHVWRNELENKIGNQIQDGIN